MGFVMSCSHCGAGDLGSVNSERYRSWRESVVAGELRGRGTRGYGAGGRFSRCHIEGNWNRELHRVEIVGEERRTWVRLFDILEIQCMKLK